MLNKKQKGEIDMQINKNMLIGEILELDVETAPFFFEMGMHCLGSRR